MHIIRRGKKQCVSHSFAHLFIECHLKCGALHYSLPFKWNKYALSFNSLVRENMQNVAHNIASKNYKHKKCDTLSKKRTKNESNKSTSTCYNNLNLTFLSRCSSTNTQLDGELVLINYNPQWSFCTIFSPFFFFSASFAMNPTKVVNVFFLSS